MVANAILKILHEISLPDRLKKKKSIADRLSISRERQSSESVNTYSLHATSTVSLFLALCERSNQKKWRKLKRLKQRMEKLKKLKPRP